MKAQLENKKDALLDEKPKTLWNESIKRLKRDKLAILGGFIILIMIFFAFLANIISPYDPTMQFNNGTTAFGMPFPIDSYSKKIVFTRNETNEEFSILPSLIFKDQSGISYRTVSVTKVKKGETKIEAIVAPASPKDVTKSVSLDMRADATETPSYKETVDKLNSKFQSMKLENDKYFLLGTDKQGRDSFSRLVWGARVSLQVGLYSILFATIIGVILGLVSGYFGGWVDMAIMRFTDIMMSMPDLLLVMALVSVLPKDESGRSAQGIGVIVFSIGIVSWTGIARLVRSQVFTVKEMEYVDAAKAAGSSNSVILFKHLLPNVVAPVIVISTMNIAGAIMTEAGLSFLGFGVKPPTPSWGSMVNEGLEFFKDAPWVPIIPGAAIALAVFAFNLFGDGVRDAIDPKLK
ncbi:MAG: ABC transporter permease [Candidatus Sericytochromatia bacterium]